ncbi:hypothetical protein [Atopococcus tabaci]|uniref:hypothetical protein n=1 Tax=Atopococcus tabaci TaxID=269774 RepID=UPI000425FBA7|nr:hypothetical protein [Atopococcus tabaci]
MAIKAIINQQLVLTPADNQTNIPLTFQLEKEYERLVIEFAYGPSHATEAEAFEQVREALGNYFPSDEPVADELVRAHLPVENLVTLSLSYNGEYLGARHTKERDLKVVLSEEKASLGFAPQPILPGKWEVQLNAHSVASEKVIANLRVCAEGVSVDEPVRSGIAQPHESQ